MSLAEGEKVDVGVEVRIGIGSSDAAMARGNFSNRNPKDSEGLDLGCDMEVPVSTSPVERLDACGVTGQEDRIVIMVHHGECKFSSKFQQGVLAPREVGLERNLGVADGSLNPALILKPSPKVVMVENLAVVAK